MLFPDSVVDEWILALAAFIIAVGIIWKGMSSIYNVVRRMEDTLGVDEQGRTISERLNRVEHQLFPNGGSSLTDKINRIAFEQREMKHELDLVKVQINGIPKRTD
jgi:uncharacterized membrane protein